MTAVLWPTKDAGEIKNTRFGRLPLLTNTRLTNNVDTNEYTEKVDISKVFSTKFSLGKYNQHFNDTFLTKPRISFT